MFYINTRQCLSLDKMLMFLKNIPIILLWKYAVLSVPFRFYHLHTVFLHISLSNLGSILEVCLNPRYFRRGNTAMKFQKGKV